MTEFSNTQIAFSIRSNSELRKANLLFQALSYPWIVSAGNKIIGFLSGLGFPVNWIVKPTVYRQFVGGETLDECLPVVKKLAGAGVRSILDYSVEGRDDEKGINGALEETLKAIRFAGVNENVPFAVFKPTAFIPSKALEELGTSDSPSEFARAEGESFFQRVRLMCQTAVAAGVPIMIDAEDVCYQNHIDKVVYDMQKEFNKGKAMVFNTYQMYRKDRLEILERDIRRARDEKYYLGAKFVRGAYMERERERARKLNLTDPIHPDKESTDRAYNDALKLAMGNLDVVSIFNGTHNEYSSLYLTILMKDAGIEAGDPRIWFSQLYGMSDHISFNLAHLGYNVAKYLPYGPVKHVLPYLTRRASENTSVKGQTGRELSMIREELKRRRSI